MVTFEVVPVDSPDAVAALRGYFASVGAVFFEHELDEDEVTVTMRDNLAPGLAPPSGLFVIAWDDGRLAGCGGLTWHDADGFAEVKHLHVIPQARGRGIGERLMGDLEQRARDRGCTALRLDTRANLWAARRLYSRLGFAEIPRYSANPMAQAWYEKPLS